MLEEAMAQLTANQEKIAATEGKGPTWEDKVRFRTLNTLLNAASVTMSGSTVSIWGRQVRHIG
jgi:hypothetical protein